MIAIADVTENFRAVQARIDNALHQFGRDGGSVQLIAVSKTKPVAAIRALYQCGQVHFGESYLQEALGKVQQLQDCAINWHFIGPIQANKTAEIAACFHWVHSVDRVKVAKRLHAQRPDGLEPLNVCVQVNIGGEASKSGIAVDALPELIQTIRILPRLRLRGLMAIPPLRMTVVEQRYYFKALRLAYEKWQSQGLPLDTLSMGMSQDLEAAIAEGATMVRIGTALFGKRNKLVNGTNESAHNV